MEAAGGSAQIAAGSYALAGAALETGRAVDRRRVESALAGAWSYLARRKDDLTRSLRDGKRHSEAPPRTYAELGLLALPENDPVAPALLEAMLGKRIESTYTAALQAVALAQLDAAKHRGRIELCHRWLAERQCANGQWDYGSSEPRRPPSGDNSCSAYAALGLRACRDAGIEVDREVARRARAWWLQAQNPDGGWGYNESGQLAPEQASRPDEAGSASYGSATASGVSSILALSSVLGEDSSTHASVRRGLDWIARNHAPDRNPRKAPGFSHLHYWLALERLGLSLGTERLGTHEWYVEGAEFLLSRQGPDGSWKVEDGDFMGRETPGVLDTCLAVLFLRRVPYSREERW
jgi:squalene cyclase